ncbi:MAG: Kdo hydroxylase family protein [Sphingobium sp.]|nr:Kdo hydroxylase family protein [Sphingobium sp.]
MPELFVNPKLPNYFVEAAEVASGRIEKSYVPEYESGKVITFPNLKIDIDFDFWANLDRESNRNLKKFRSSVANFDMHDVDDHLQRMIEAGVNDTTAEKLIDNMRSIYQQIIPTYLSIFSGYEFTKRKTVWRLATVMNENMHIDAYKGESEDYPARMFINLDNQPRIWQTSWPVDDICAMNAGKIDPRKLENMTRGDVWAQLNHVTFGKGTAEWWDSQPRHVSYFDPGDIWIVDSRQISHQIFYGRRALSIDFAIPGRSMLEPARHYLNLAEQFRTKNASLQEA